MTRRHIRRPRTTAERRAAAAARAPRPTTRDFSDVPHIVLAENALWWATIHEDMGRGDHESRWRESAQWDAEQAAKHLAATDGPRSVRTRARRLARRLARVLALVCD